jgi:hypothetical protein
MRPIKSLKAWQNVRDVGGSGWATFANTGDLVLIGHAPYLVRDAQESAWHEDHRRVDNGRRVQAVMELAMAAPVSVDWYGYWQHTSN